MGPAIGRYIAYLSLWQAASSEPVVAHVLLIVVGVAAFALPLTLVVHDLHTRRRLHPATGWGVLGLFVVGVGFQFGISATAAGRALVIALQ
ncbi:MAG: hypothetical protein ACREUT_09635 [Steroidobacteraceae bacterium]